MILVIQALIPFGRVPPHLIGPFEVKFIFYLLKDLIYWLLEHQADHWSITIGGLAKKVCPWSVKAISIRLRIPSLRCENLGLPLALYLIFFSPLVFINAIH